MGLRKEVHEDYSRNSIGIPWGTQKEFCKEIDGDSLMKSAGVSEGDHGDPSWKASEILQGNQWCLLWGVMWNLSRLPCRKSRV